MIKGIWWHIVVLLLAESLWLSSCLNNQQQQRRRMRNNIYLQRLRNARYLPPIPVRIPQYHKEQPEHITPEHITRSPSKKEALAPWIPMYRTAEAVPSRNIYVPPLRPPSIIVTRKPLKTSFEVPLKKSIQVSQAKPKIQTVGYIRKHLIKVPTAKPTQNPQLKVLGTSSESTVHSLLNFTPVDDGWRPKVLTTPNPAIVPNSNFNKKINSNVDTHLNHTGKRLGDIRLKTKPENEAQFGVLRNKTNFVMKFNPGDIRISSENIHTPFYPSSSVEKHLAGSQNDHRTLSDESADSQKVSSNLWKEGNYPYQGHKTTQQKASVVNNGAPNRDKPDAYSDWKTIYDSFQSPQNLRTDFPKKDVAQSQNQGSFVNDPYNAEIFNSAFENNKRSRNQNVGIFTKQKYNNQDVKTVQTGFPNSHEDEQSTRLEHSKVYKSGTNQQINSNFQNQGPATVIKQPSHVDSQYSSENIMNNRYQAQQIPSNKPKALPSLTEIIEKESSNNGFKSSVLNTPIDSSVNHSYVNNKDSSSSKPTPDEKTIKYNSMSNNFKNNNTLAKEKITISEIPLPVRNQYNNSKSPNIRSDLKFQNTDKSHDSTNRQKTKIYLSSPKLQLFVPMYNHNFSLFQKNHNIRLIEDNNPEKAPFVPSPELREVELKNPPKHLEFGDEDFLKPIVPIHFHENSDSNKKISSFKFSARDRSGEINKPISAIKKEAEKKLIKTTTEVPSSKVEYQDNSMVQNKKPLKEAFDNVYFQPVFPEVSLNNHHAPSTQKFQNYNNDQSSQQLSDTSKGDKSTRKSATNLSGKEISKSRDTSREKPKINNDVIVTKNTDYSPKETKINNIQGVSNGMPRIITPPPVITMKYEPGESGILNTRDSKNRSDNYVIQLKPALIPENSNRPRGPKITLSTGMLAGILIAALIFLAFLTGSMVYAFHQWKFGRKKKDRQKTKVSRSPRFPPEFLDENFAGNTYIHNNIFLPTPQNLEDRSSTEPDTSSMAGDEVVQEPTSTSARVRRHPGVFRESREE